MYDRKVNGKVLEFNTSGALYHNALVMMDDQSDSFWAVISSQAIGGPMQGKPLAELPISEKTQWAKWLAKHPNTLLLQVEGVNHLANNPYDNYFQNDKPFRPVKDPDTRLPLKEAIYGFKVDGTVYALSHANLTGGWVGRAGKVPVGLFRTPGDAIYRSTHAYRLLHKGKPIDLSKRGEIWVSALHGEFNPVSGRFSKSPISLERLGGMDTFWYIWSEYHKGVTLLGR